MDPILSPWLIYLLWVLTGLKAASLFILCLSLLVVIFYGVFDLCEGEGTKHKWIFKLAGITIVVSGVIYLLIPPKEYLAAMVVTSYVTPENMHALNEVIKSTLGDYLSVIKSGI